MNLELNFNKNDNKFFNNRLTVSPCVGFHPQLLEKLS